MTMENLPTPDMNRPKPRLSWIWLMPLMAVFIALAVLWQVYSERGRLIVVTFPTAEGIEAGQTPVRYRDLDIGIVESLGFSEGLASIEVGIRVDQNIAPYVDEDASFWIVRPKVSARGITGLNTVLSGAHIEGSWDGTPGIEASRFSGLDAAPLAPPGAQGAHIILRARSGGNLVSGAPVLFNGISVGWIGDPILSEDGLTITRDAFIEAPYHEHLYSASRFWDSSGASLDINATGVTLNLDSIAALLEGGVTFATMMTGGQEIEDGHVFDVFESQREARANALELGGTRLEISALLDPETIGLSVGSVVRYGSAKVGEIIAITGYRDVAVDDNEAKLLIEMEIVPARLNVAEDLTESDMLAALDERVQAGLRLRVGREGILGQRRILEFVEDRDASVESIVTDITPTPLVPTVDAAPRSDVPESFNGLVARISDLPIEDLMNSAIEALDSVTGLAGSPDARELPANANSFVSEARDLIGSEDIVQALADFRVAASDLRDLSETVSQSEGLATLLTALEASDTIGANISTFSERLPGIADDVEEITAEIKSVPFTELAKSLDSLTQRIEGVLNADGIEDLPVSLRDTLSELQGALSDLRDGGAVDNLNQTLAAVQEASGNVPDLVDRLDRVSVTLQDTLGGYAQGSRFQVELTGAIRDISEAADALRSLARKIERNPSSLISGR